MSRIQVIDREKNTITVDLNLMKNKHFLVVEEVGTKKMRIYSVY
jgi:hypothetical protein